MCWTLSKCPMDRLSLCLTQLTLNRYLIVEFDSFDLDSASFYLDILLLEYLNTEEDLRPLYNALQILKYETHRWAGWISQKLTSKTKLGNIFLSWTSTRL